MEALTNALLVFAELIVFAIAIPATAFPLVYAWFFHWRKYDAGRTVMTATVALALLVDLSIVMSLVEPPMLVRALVTVGVLLLVLAGSVYKLVVLLRKLFARGCEREEDSRRK